MINVVETLVVSGEIMMASISFEIQPLKLTLLFVFILLCQCSLILLMNNLALSKAWSSDGSETEI